MDGRMPVSSRRTGNTTSASGSGTGGSDHRRRDRLDNRPRRCGVEEKLARRGDRAALVPEPDAEVGFPVRRDDTGIRPSIPAKAVDQPLRKRAVLRESPDLASVTRDDRHCHVVGAAKPERKDGVVEPSITIWRKAAVEVEVLEHGRRAL